MTAGTLITILAAGWSIALLLAAWWAWGSVRSWWFSRGGKRAGTPYCRACNFDLTGLTRDDATPAKCCPECGAEIDRAGAVAVGKAITRRPKLKWAALAVALVTTLVFATLTVLRPPALWMHRMPDWVLVRTAKSGADRDAENALRELSRRWGFVSWMPSPWSVSTITGLNYPADALPMGGKQPPNLAAVAELAREALERQNDRSRAWSSTWGQVIESAIAKNLLDSSEIAKYRSNWLSLDFRFSPRIRRGEPLVAEVIIKSVRTPRQLGLRLAVSGTTARDTFTQMRSEVKDIQLYEGSVIRLPVHGTLGLSLGDNEVNVAKIVESSAGTNRILETTIATTVSVQVLEPSALVSPVIRDPELDQAMRGLLSGLLIEMGSSGESQLGSRKEIVGGRRTYWAGLTMHVGRMPRVPLTARMEFRDWENPESDPLAVGAVVVQQTGLYTGLSVLEDFPGAAPSWLAKPWVHVRFVSDASLVESLTQPDGYWEGQIDFPKVPIYSFGIPGIPDRARPR